MVSRVRVRDRIIVIRCRDFAAQWWTAEHLAENAQRLSHRRYLQKRLNRSKMEAFSTGPKNSGLQLSATWRIGLP